MVGVVGNLIYKDETPLGFRFWNNYAAMDLVRDAFNASLRLMEWFYRSPKNKKPSKITDQHSSIAILPSPSVGNTGFEPVTSALSRQRSKPTELIAHLSFRMDC